MQATTKKRARHGIAVMREFYSAEGIDESCEQILESLGDAALTALFHPERDWTPTQQRNLIGVLLRTAYQVGRNKGDGEEEPRL